MVTLLRQMKNQMRPARAAPATREKNLTADGADKRMGKAPQRPGIKRMATKKRKRHKKDSN
jgi:hypothetical protein